MEIWETLKNDPIVGAERLVAEYGDRLFSAALMLSQDSHSAEELVSRTICQAVVKVGLFDPAYSFWNWLYTILLNFYRTDMRKCRAEVADDPDFVEEHYDTSDTPDARLSAVDAELMREAVARLPPSLRIVVLLRYFEDRTLDEIVQITGAPSGTVKVRLHRARAQLNRILSALFGKEEGRQ